MCWWQSPRQPCDVVSVPPDATCAGGRVVKQDEGGGRGRDTISLSFSPLHERMGVYWRPYQPTLFPYNPSVAFPTRWTRGDSATVRSHTDGCGDVWTREGKTDGGIVLGVASRVPYFAVSSAHAVLRLFLVIHAFYLLPLAQSVPRVLVTHASSCRSPGISSHGAGDHRWFSCSENTGERSREDVLRCVRSRIDQPPRGWACTRLSPMRRKYRSVYPGENTSRDSTHPRNFARYTHRNFISFNLGKINDRHPSREICIYNYRSRCCCQNKSGYSYTRGYQSIVCLANYLGIRMLKIANNIQIF